METGTNKGHELGRVGLQRTHTKPKPKPTPTNPPVPYRHGAAVLVVNVVGLLLPERVDLPFVESRQHHDAAAAVDEALEEGLARDLLVLFFRGGGKKEKAVERNEMISTHTHAQPPPTHTQHAAHAPSRSVR